MNEQDLDGLLAFLTRAGDLKDTMRSGFTNAGLPESTAAHSWRLGLWVMALEPYLDGYDLAALYRMALVHDLGEAVTGDVPATQQTGDQSARQKAEREAVRDMTSSLPDTAGDAIIASAQAYDEGRSKEARLMKGLDKLETLLQHATGSNPSDFDYRFNLTYGRGWTDEDKLLGRIRARLDAMTLAAAQTS